jgi:hypothetical protein
MAVLTIILDAQMELTMTAIMASVVGALLGVQLVMNRAHVSKAAMILALIVWVTLTPV